MKDSSEGIIGPDGDQGSDGVVVPDGVVENHRGN